MVATRGSRLLATLVLARLLAPEMFGIIGMAYVTMEILQRVREMGFGLAYIQRQYADFDEERIAANTTFWLGCIINAALFIAAFLLAPAMGAFFRSEDAQEVLRVLCFGFLIDILIALPSLDLQKRLEFKRLAICEVAEALSYMLIAISLALLDFGVWSLVYGQLASKIVLLICLFRASLWRPRFEFSGQMAFELFRFGKYMWAFVLLSGVGDALDKLIVGRYYGEAELGFYSMAFLLATLPATNITMLVNRLTFPLFSKMQSQLVELRAALGKALSHVAVLALPTAVGMLVVAPLFVNVVLQEKWAPIVPLVGVLCFYGMILSIAAVTGPALQAIGKPNVLFYTSIVHHAAKIALLIALKDQGTVGICYAVLIPILISSSIAFVLIVRYLKFPLPDLFLPILRPAFAAAVMFVGVQLVIQGAAVFPAVPQVLLLVLSILIGACIYLGVSYFTNRLVLTEFIRALHNMLGLQRTNAIV